MSGKASCIMAAIVLPIAWTFGFFMMTNARLTLELRQTETDLRELAMTDYLTGAYNRRSFDDLGRREVARARRNGSPLALLIIDIDHFKIFNDTLRAPGRRRAVVQPGGSLAAFIYDRWTCWRAGAARNSPCCCRIPTGHRQPERGRKAAPGCGTADRAGRQASRRR